jgi:hypothetical protein
VVIGLGRPIPAQVALALARILLRILRILLVSGVVIASIGLSDTAVDAKWKINYIAVYQ